MLSEPARLVLSAGAVQLSPARLLNAFEVAFTAGYGDEASDVPAPIRHALKLLVAHWFEHREPVVVGAAPHRGAGDGSRPALAIPAGEAMTEFSPSDLRHRLTLEQLSRLEFGTRRSRASPWLVPALHARLPGINHAVRKVIAAALKAPAKV